MLFPTKEEFLKLSRKGNLIPVYREIAADFETPLSAFLKVDNGKFSYLLESTTGGEKIARYSFLGSRPSLIFSSKGRDITIQEGKTKKTFYSRQGPLAEIKKIMERFKFVHVPGLPRFCGGLVGYMGYDVVRFFEKIPDKTKDELGVPDSFFMLTDTILIFDHVDRTIKIVSNAFVDKDARMVYDEAARKIEKVANMLSGSGKTSPGGRKSRKPRGKPAFQSNLTRSEFMGIVKKAKEYIKKGDIIQAVLSQRLKTRVTCKSFDIYRSLRRINPSPYMFYLKFDEFRLVGASPEIMVRCEDGKVELRPIAGTKPRGRDEKEDRAFAKELLGDPKEKAEHLMLVDLGRNDVGRVCRFDSVKVSEFMVIEKYSHVMHIVSNVSGALKRGNDIYDVVKASFPAGTVTGAPKIRAMEIIDELENTKRGIYAGSVGYFSFSGNLDTCIAIRTIVVSGKNAYVQAGAGIVADSNPAREYRETLSKARAMLKAIAQAERGI